jgi:CelD/BcsL family acetyltransferase involved in cellulose biosynthesis
VLRDSGDRPIAILPLAITRRFGTRFAGFIGGKHANYHMGVFAPDFAASLDTDGSRAMLAEVAVALGGLDAFAFVNQPTHWQGLANPLAALAAGPSPSSSYKLALNCSDCDGTLRRAMSSHAHKKMKNKRNRFASYGASRMGRAEGPAEVARVLRAFLEQKAARFRMMGIANPFDEPGVRAFLEQGSLPRGGAPAALELYSLDVDGRAVATYVGTQQGERFSGMATSFDMEGEIAKTSPGEILLVDLIKLKCQQGVRVIDLGVGEARYKTTICDDKDDLVDSFIPLTTKGRAFATLARAKRAAKRRIKASLLLLKLARRGAGLLKRGKREQVEPGVEVAQARRGRATTRRSRAARLQG